MEQSATFLKIAQINIVITTNLYYSSKPICKMFKVDEQIVIKSKLKWPLDNLAFYCFRRAYQEGYSHTMDSSREDSGQNGQ